jgi:predicted anti-sigma-YlaC factor YlaD
MDCHEAKNYISLYIDEEISDNKAEELLQHTRECAACRQLLLDMEHLSLLLRTAGQPIMAAPEGLKDSIMEELGHKKDFPAGAYDEAYKGRLEAIEQQDKG